MHFLIIIKFWLFLETKFDYKSRINGKWVIKLSILSRITKGIPIVSISEDPIYFHWIVSES